MNESLIQRYKSIRDFTIELCIPLKTEDYVAQPVADVSPPKWHLAHTTWFFEAFILIENLSDYTEFHPEFNYLFNSYYNTAGERVKRPDRGMMTRPTVEEVLKFRAHVDRGILKLLKKELSPEILKFLEIGLQHEQQHQELLVCDIKSILDQYPLFPVYKEGYKASGLKAMPLSYYRFKEDIYEIGAKTDEFVFDNENEKHKVFLREFHIADRLITNAEYFEFIQSGAYENFKFWLSEGWDWIQNTGIKAPKYWYLIDEEWKMFTLNGLQEIDWHAPVTHVNFFEADAFARWKGKRLPTEAEWEVAALDYGNLEKGNFIDEGEFKTRANKGNQFFGDCWEWCNSAYLAYPGYKQEEGALGEYNGKFMSSQMVLRGGSCASSRSHLRATYRNFFHPHLQWQFTGIRLVKDK